MNEAIRNLMGRGYTEKEAMVEFGDLVDRYMSGTLRTEEDRTYAIKCALEDIMDDEAGEISEEYLDMLDMVYV